MSYYIMFFLNLFILNEYTLTCNVSEWCLADLLGDYSLQVYNIFISRRKKIILTRVCDVIGERAKRARHSQVCSIENRGYILYIIYYI